MCILCVSVYIILLKLVNDFSDCLKSLDRGGGWVCGVSSTHFFVGFLEFL